MRFVVVGAGIVGVNVAEQLARRGAQVTLVERDLPGEGTSGSTFAWIDASHPSLAPYVELNVDGLAAWRRLAGELGDPWWLALPGTLTWSEAPDEREQLEEHVRVLDGLGHAAVRLTPDDARRREPDLVVERGVDTVFLFEGEGWVFARPAIAELLARGRAAGLELRTGVEVVQFATHGERVSGVVLDSGEELAADVIVTCVGRWTEGLLARAGVEVPMISPEPAASPAVGLLVLTTPTLCRLRHVVFADGLMVRPDGGGRILLHSDAHDLHVSSRTPVVPPPSEAGELVDLLRARVHGAEAARVESARIGIRALPVDRLPVVGHALEGLYVVATHSGITLAPALGELVAAELVDDQQSDALERFRPARFEREVA